MGRLRFAFACSPYDRMRALMEGSVVPEGIDLNFIPLEVEEIFWRQLRHREFDGCEMSLSSYAMARSRGDDRFIAIPAFTSRFFRHSCVYVNTSKGIGVPQDLKGRIVGVPEYQMTAALWVRGIFQHEHGVHPRDIHWRTGGEEAPGREEKIRLELPPDVDCEPIPADKTLSRMLDEGEIDGLFAPRAPSCFQSGSPNVARLFRDYAAEEEAYYRKTRIFPIMHCVVITRAVYEANPWVAMSLYKSCLAAKDRALANLRHTYALHASLPWLVREVERTREIMGEDWWPYGVEKNRDTMEALCQYSFEQGLSARRMKVEELFAPETLDEFKI
ncbi:MAG: ABC transporter substrate-binding protein [bacterium]